VRELRSKTGATGKKGNGKCRPCGPNKNGANSKRFILFKLFLTKSKSINLAFLLANLL